MKTAPFECGPALDNFGRAGNIVQVVVRNPRRELTLTGVRSVTNLLRQLEIHPETVLVIVNGELVPKDASLSDTDAVEIRSVISGGSDSA